MDLDTQSTKILRCISRHTPLDITGLLIYTSITSGDIDTRIGHLLSEELIEIDKSNQNSSASPMYKLTIKGEIKLENELRSIRDHNFNEFRAWITLLIAIAAFILSVISLLLQYI